MTDTKQSWQVLAGLFILYMGVVGIQVYTLPLFYPLLIDEFGWSISEVSRAATIGYAVNAAIAPFVSPLYDRVSVRLLMVVGLLFAVASLWLFAYIHSLPQMLALYMLFTLSQLCAGQMPVMVLISRWFGKQQGLATGIVVTATSAGGALFPLLLQPVFADGDWRTAAKLLAACSLVMMAVPLWWVIRNSPAPSAVAATPLTELLPLTPPASSPTGGLTLRAALGTPTFYLIAVATGGLWFSSNGMVQHQSVMLREFGIDKATLPFVISVYFWAAIVGKLFFGWLADHYNKHWALLGAVLCLAAGLVQLRVDGGHLAYGYAIGFGLGFGGSYALIQILILHHFAGQHYGRILGLLTSIDTVPGVLSVPLLSTLYAANNSYIPALNLLLGMAVMVTVAVVSLGFYSLRRSELSQRLA
jgi:MFS transporter, OFA family, oxalate/formate antiporter